MEQQYEKTKEVYRKTEIKEGEWNTSFI